MSKKIKVAHTTPGRIRLKVPHAKGDAALLQQVAQTFSVIPGVEKVDVNPVTGSLVVVYDPDHHATMNTSVMAKAEGEGMAGPPPPRPPKTEFDEIANSIEHEAEFLAQNSELVKHLVEWSKRADRELRLATNNNVDLKLVFAGGVIAATVLEVGAWAATPVWMTLALFAMNHYVELHRQPLPARAPAPAPRLLPSPA